MIGRSVPALTALVLAGLLAVLGSALAERLTREIDISPIAAGAGNASADGILPSALPEWDGLDPTSLTAIVEAPLFIEGRRMPDDPRAPKVAEVEAAPEPEAAPPAPVAPPDYDLLGVLIAPGESKALVMSRGDREETWVAARDKLGAWTVEAITQDHVMLRHEDETRKIEMRHEGRVQ